MRKFKVIDKIKQESPEFDLLHTALTYIPVFNRLCITHYPKLTTLQNKEIAPSTYEASSTGNTELWFLFIGFVLGKTKMILSFAEKLLMLDFTLIPAFFPLQAAVIDAGSPLILSL